MSKENTSGDFPGKSQYSSTVGIIQELSISILMDKFMVYPPILLSLIMPILSLLRGKQQISPSRTVCTAGSLVVERYSGSSSFSIQKFPLIRRISNLDTPNVFHINREILP